MFCSLAIQSYINWMTSNLTDYNLVGAVYVPELDFRKAAQDRLQLFGQVVTNHIKPYLTDQGVRSSKWSVFAWSREGINNDINFQLRNWPTRITTDINGGDTQVVHLKLVNLPLTAVIFCNSVTLGETLEEYMEVLIHNAKELSFTLPTLEQSFPVYMSRAEDITFEKLPSSEMGAITSVGFSVNLIFPIFNDLGSSKIILEIIVKEYLQNYSGSVDYLYRTYSIVPD